MQGTSYVYQNASAGAIKSPVRSYRTVQISHITYTSAFEVAYLAQNLYELFQRPQKESKI